MLRFLQTLQNFKVDRECKGISRADLDNVLLQVRTVTADVHENMGIFLSSIVTLLL